MEKQKVSVVLPTFNRASSLARAIQSVLAQTYRNLELIVVDDASSDGTLDVLRSFQDSRLRWIRNQSRTGVSAARNRGASEASGEWLAFQDSDDEWRVEKLARQMRAADSDVALVLCGDLVVNDYAYSFMGVATDAPIVDLDDQLLIRIPGAQCFLVPRSVFAATRGFDVQLNCSEDWELALRLSEHGRVRMVNEPLVIRQKTPGSLYSDEPSRARNLRIILKRHQPRFKHHPQAWASHCNLLGQSECLQGRMSDGRQWILKALSAAPASLRTWANLTFSFMGVTIFRRYLTVARFLRSRLVPPTRPLPATQLD